MLELIALLIVTIISAALSLFVYTKNPRSATNRSFSFFAASLVFWSITMYLSINPPAGSHLFFIRLSMLAAIVMSYGALLLSHTFPSASFLLDKKKFIVITLISLLGSVVAMSNYMFTGIKISDGNIEPIVGPGMIMFMISGLGYTLLSMILIIRKYLRSEGRLKSQLHSIAIGIVLMFSLLITANFIVVLIFKSSALINFGPLFTLPFLVLSAYAIVRHKFLDISLILFRAVSFTLLTLVVVGIFAGSLFTLSNLVSVKYHDILTVLFALVLVYTHEPLKRFIERVTKNIFFKQPYVTDDLLEELGETIRSTLSLTYLTDKVLKLLTSKMNISWGAFVTKDDKSYRVKAVGLNHALHLTDNTVHNLSNAAKRKIVLFDELDEGPVKMLMREHSISAIIPLIVKKTRHGLLLLGEKSSGEIYSQQDIDVMEIFAPQMSVAVQNALSYEEISNFNVTLKEEIKAATKEIRGANRDLRKLNKLKDDFVFVATHELKNPVTALKGYLSMVNEGMFGKIPKKLQEPIDQMSASSQQLVTLINDLLNIARSEAGSVNLSIEEVDLCPIIDQIIGNVTVLAKQKSLKLTHTCSVKQAVKADRNKMMEIVNNLLSNAIKYSEKGTISVSHEEKDKMIVTAVADQGVGIPKEYQEKIFTRFYRVEEEAAKGTPGTGLGLFIVKDLIEKMNGEIWFETEYGKGTTFFFSLPKA